MGKVNGASYVVEQQLWYDYICPECRNEWESQQSEPGRVWCTCGSGEEPERFDGAHD